MNSPIVDLSKLKLLVLNLGFKLDVTLLSLWVWPEVEGIVGSTYYNFEIVDFSS